MEQLAGIQDSDPWREIITVCGGDSILVVVMVVVFILLQVGKRTVIVPQDSIHGFQLRGTEVGSRFRSTGIGLDDGLLWIQSLDP